MDIRSVADHIRDTPFLNELLAEFVVRGLGSLPGRETTITLVGLLLKHHSGWRDSPPHDYELARLLRTSPRKIRNIRNELSYRAATHDDDWCRSKLAQELERAELLSDGKFVSFQIDDGLVRDFAQKLVREQYGLICFNLQATVPEGDFWHSSWLKHQTSCLNLPASSNMGSSRIRPELSDYEDQPPAFRRAGATGHAAGRQTMSASEDQNPFNSPTQIAPSAVSGRVLKERRRQSRRNSRQVVDCGCHGRNQRGW